MLLSDRAMLGEEIIRQFNSVRESTDNSVLCHAPFKSFCLNTLGNPGACHATYLPDRAEAFPRKSLKEIWFGKYFQTLRENISKNNLSEYCQYCERELLNKNFTSVLINGYNPQPANASGYPSLIELDLSNQCNLECIMCKGDLSSNVRVDREKKSPLPRIYEDPLFLTQLEEFIPHLTEARFNGGEPLLSDIYYQVWELIISLKKSVLLSITTNGTIYSERFERILRAGTCRLIVSIDSLEKTTYETIRKNAHFETTMENLFRYKRLCQERNIPLQIVVNPMRLNWSELPAFIRFGNQNNLRIWFHTFVQPRQLTIKDLPAREIQKIYDYLLAHAVLPQKEQSAYEHWNNMIFYNYIHCQLKPWLTAALRQERMTTHDR
jgi:molybdenum cofactor biosynthesis enzyme MoaA